MNILNNIGYNTLIQQYFQNSEFIPARVIGQHKDRYQVITEIGSFPAEVTGHLRFSAETAQDLPVVGDWVAVMPFDDLVLINSILPRKSLICRKAVDKFGKRQPIASNIDIALIVQALDRDFNINRIERYATIAFAEGIEPWVVLNKKDLVSEQDLHAKVADIHNRLKGIKIISTSLLDTDSLNHLKSQLQNGYTYCMLGSSGVGKSSLINALVGNQLMSTNDISSSTAKGKHTTTHRELILLPNGGAIIDNPGMREVGMTNVAEGLEITFEQISELSKSCRFKNCKHIDEPGCAILQALEDGTLEPNSFYNYQKMAKETAFFTLSEAEKRKKDRQFGKMAKEIIKLKKNR